MRNKWFILLAVLLLALVGGAVAAYAYDSSRDDLIVEGVTVAGVDVGGMRVDAARRAVARQLEEPLGQPIAVKRGLKVRAARLEQRLAQALTVPGADRRFRAPARILRPKVTQAELEDKYPVVLIADRANFQLRYYERLNLVRSYTVAVGAVGFDTPAGLYHIQNKAVDPAWSVPDSDWAGDLAGTVVPGGVPENPLKERWLGIYDGAGIHGTDVTSSLGSAASHGCIRMAIPDVIELYDKVPVGAPIYIA